MTVKNPVDYDELYPGRFIKSGDLRGRDVNLTIARIEVDDLEGSKGKQAKGIVHFKGTQKALVLNRTNGECLKAMFGRRIADWIGKRVTLYPAKIESEVADLAIRVRGSPDLAADVPFELHLARNKPRKMVMRKTAAGNAAASAPSPEPEPEPEDPSGEDPEGLDPIRDPVTGEVFP